MSLQMIDLLKAFQYDRTLTFGQIRVELEDKVYHIEKVLNVCFQAHSHLTDPEIN